jgi:hypothetical protein
LAAAARDKVRVGQRRFVGKRKDRRKASQWRRSGIRHEGRKFAVTK